MSNIHLYDDVESLTQKYLCVDRSDADSNVNRTLYHQWFQTSVKLFSEFFDVQNDELYSHFVSSGEQKNTSNGFFLNDFFYEIITTHTRLMSLIKQKLEKNHNPNPPIVDRIDENYNGCRKALSRGGNCVFLVHGHDNEAKISVARFIEKLGLEVIILHEQSNKGRTILQKLFEESSRAAYAIVLYTPCDEGRAIGETKLNYRARQNVVFEHGLLAAQLGPEKVCCLVKGDIELPGDNSGVLYTKMDDAGAWKQFLLTEFEDAGLDLDPKNYSSALR